MSDEAGDRSPTAFLADALETRDAAAFVHVGREQDPTLRYLFRMASGRPWKSLARTPPTQTCAFVYADGRTWLCFPEHVEPRILSSDAVASRSFPHDRHVGECAASILAEADITGTILVPPHVPHDAALYLEQAGFDLASTPAVETARAVKSETEIDRLRAVHRAAVAGLTRAGEVLAEATATEEDGFVWNDTSLTAASLRREINATLAQQDVSDAGNTRIDGNLRPGRPIQVALAPCGPYGYHTRLGRTFVVDGDGGWERRAHVAVTSARRVALAELEPETEASWIREETIAELGSFGFTVGAPDGGALPDVGGGIGLAREEAPSFRRETELEPGHVVTVAPGVRHEEHGSIRTVDVAVVTADGAEWLAEVPTSISPSAYTDSD